MSKIERFDEPAEEMCKYKYVEFRCHVLRRKGAVLGVQGKLERDPHRGINGVEDRPCLLRRGNQQNYQNQEIQEGEPEYEFPHNRMRSNERARREGKQANRQEYRDRIWDRRRERRRERFERSRTVGGVPDNDAHHSEDPNGMALVEPGDRDVDDRTIFAVGILRSEPFSVHAFLATCRVVIVHLGARGDLVFHKFWTGEYSNLGFHIRCS